MTQLQRYFLFFVMHKLFLLIVGHLRVFFSVGDQYHLFPPQTFKKQPFNQTSICLQKTNITPTTMANSRLAANTVFEAKNSFSSQPASVQEPATSAPFPIKNITTT